MACCVGEKKSDECFNEILEDLENEEGVEMFSEEMCNKESIHSFFLYFYSSLFFSSIQAWISTTKPTWLLKWLHMDTQKVNFLSTYQRCSIKKGILKNFTKLTGNHVCLSLIFNKVAGHRPATLFKKETLLQVFSWEFCEIFKSTFIAEQLWTTALRETSLTLLCALKCFQKTSLSKTWVKLHEHKMRVYHDIAPAHLFLKSVSMQYSWVDYVAVSFIFVKIRLSE